MKTIIGLDKEDIKELIMKEYNLTNKDEITFIITDDIDMRGEVCGHKITIRAILKP